MRHPINEQSWYKIMLDLIRTALYEDKPNGDEEDENINNTGSPDSNDALQ